MKYKKYLAVINTFWQRALTYRFTVFAYRIGEIVELLALIILWSAIFQQASAVGDFTLKEMVTYLLIGNLFRVIVRNFLADAIEEDIKDGKLSLYLVKPMTYFQFILTKEIGRISIATIMSIISQVFVTALFYNLFIFNFDPIRLFLILLMLVFAFLTELLFSFLIGLIAFWTDEAEALYTSLESLKRLVSGSYFPLSLLPSLFLNISFLLPFAYSFYIPTQIYLGKIDLDLALRGLMIQVLWIIVLWLLIKFVWNKGLKRYEGVGI